MFGFSRASVIAELLAVSICFSNAFAAVCNSTWIRSQADADALRRNCPIVIGHVGIGPFDGDSTVHINLDGIELIAGTLGEYPASRHEYSTQPYYTLSSSSLRGVDAVEFGAYDTRIMNLTLPNLKRVNDYFEAGDYAYNLKYLDITSLDTASTITLSAPNLTTLHHTRLRNVTKLHIHPMQINSLDSLTDNQLNLREATLEGPFPNVDNIPIGFTSAKYLIIKDNSSVTLGGSSTTAMAVEELRLSDGVTDLKRSAQVNTLEVDTLVISSSVDITRLELPFDNLRSFMIERRAETHPMKSIILPPQALDWTGGFELHISSAPELNLTSIYDHDEKGNRIQTWYWPRNVSYIDMVDVTTGNAFFEPFVVQQKAPLDSQFPPSALKTFRVIPSANSTHFNCTPFTELVDSGRLPSARSAMFCRNSTQPTSGTTRTHAPISLSAVSAFVIFAWML